MSGYGVTTRMGDSQDLNKLEETARSVVQRFRAGRMLNEQNCRQFAIDPVLSALGWNRSSETEWIEELPLPDLYDGDRLLKVDYALCDGGRDCPMVFVEAKGPDGVTKPKNKDQLFRYGNNRGVPLLVLTDGITWRLYLAMGAGLPTEREFDTVCLTEESDGLARLIKALGRESVISGNAKHYAEGQHRKRRNAAKARDEIPQVWRQLIRSTDMEKMLFDKVTENTGWEPLIEDVRAFLKNRGVGSEESIGKPSAEYGELKSAAKANANTGRGGKIDKQRAREMLAQGVSQSDVARHFGVAPSSVGAMMRRDRERQAPENVRQPLASFADSQRATHPSRLPAGRKGKIDKDLARQMLAQGAAQTDVAHYFGVTPSSVSAMVRKDKRRQD